MAFYFERLFDPFDNHTSITQNREKARRGNDLYLKRTIPLEKKTRLIGHTLDSQTKYITFKTHDTNISKKQQTQEIYIQNAQQHYTKTYSVPKLT